jgi:predicted CoA-binding protein
MENKATLVLGASTNPERYSNRAIKSLRKHGHNVYAVGLKEGIVDDVNIKTGQPDLKDVDTVTLYLSQKNQEQYYNYILSLKPKRIIYNPGAENFDLEKLAEENKIENLEACTLVLLATGQF